jgi:hypothetical protein
MPIDATHFSMVGFQVAADNPAAFQRELDPFLQKCDLVDIDRERRLCIIRDPSGGELWVGLRAEKPDALSIITANPAFTGEGRTNVEIIAAAPSKDDVYKSFEISITAHFAGEETPLIFDLADPRQFGQFKPGAKLAVDIAAFSFDAEIYDDEAAYYAAQRKPDVKVRFAANYFIPTGLFNESAGGAGGVEGPTAYADFAGKVLKAERRTNKAGSKEFWWALVQTYGDARIDVVLDPATIDRVPKPGAIISGRFWLSARAVPAE